MQFKPTLVEVLVYWCLLCRLLELLNSCTSGTVLVQGFKHVKSLFDQCRLINILDVECLHQFKMTRSFLQVRSPRSSLEFHQAQNPLYSVWISGSLIILAIHGFHQLELQAFECKKPSTLLTQSWEAWPRIGNLQDF